MLNKINNVIIKEISGKMKTKLCYKKCWELSVSHKISRKVISAITEGGTKLINGSSITRKYQSLSLCQ